MTVRKPYNRRSFLSRVTGGVIVGSVTGLGAPTGASAQGCSDTDYLPPDGDPYGGGHGCTGLTDNDPSDQAGRGRTGGGGSAGRGSSGSTGPGATDADPSDRPGYGRGSSSRAAPAQSGSPECNSSALNQARCAANNGNRFDDDAPATPAQLAVVATPGAAPIAPPDPRYANDQTYRGYTHQIDQAARDASAAQRRIDAARAIQNNASTNNTDRQRAQIEIYNASNALQTARSAARAADINRTTYVNMSHPR